MPRAFTEQENRYIRRKLLDAGLNLFGSRGIRKVSVDELVQQANISKGAFYKFFASKEELYFSLLDEAQQKFKKDILDAAINTPSDNKAETLKFIFRQAVQSWVENPLSARLDSDDLEYVLRKMPPELIAEHMSDDADFSKQLLELCSEAGIDMGQEPQLVSGLLRSVFLVSLHEERFPAEIFPRVIDTLFDLIANYIARNSAGNYSAHRTGINND
ncbi:TetR/AcrR family transcriptional regulator [Candidatus Contubernalis alkaliaceticus]|uniref:TetR/AcrR family transcriptional regulator n=1 Tax=Candidatus Contubernalis alkaliaceticus TaxID=338645 RepID=UPI001F4C275F|nr:TetR/AcrR family transcriptional regulator [Candidatus Contubernalis alkalaceticus]UNC93013.1 TetR/AcrR family transcriptional regulator [Candidatus Contubernalis alkalaceticus]